MLTVFQSFGFDPISIANECQRLFAASSTVTEQAGISCLSVQGSVSTEISQFLTSQLGIASKYITIR